MIRQRQKLQVDGDKAALLSWNCRLEEIHLSSLTGGSYALIVPSHGEQASFLVSQHVHTHPQSLKLTPRSGFHMTLRFPCYSFLDFVSPSTTQGKSPCKCLIDAWSHSELCTPPGNSLVSFSSHYSHLFLSLTMSFSESYFQLSQVVLHPISSSSSLPFVKPTFHIYLLVAPSVAKPQVILSMAFKCRAFLPLIFYIPIKINTLGWLCLHLFQMNVWLSLMMRIIQDHHCDFHCRLSIPLTSSEESYDFLNRTALSLLCFIIGLFE